MEYFEVVKKRGSYRGEFLAEKIPEPDIREIMEAGIQAPSGYNHQTTSFVVVTDETLLKQLAAIISGPAVETAPAIIVPISEFWQAESGLSFEIEDYACAVENILLAITAKGYAGVWMDGQTKMDGNAQKIAALLQIPSNLHVRTIIPFGKPAKPVTQKEKKDFAERVFFNQFPADKG